MYLRSLNASVRPLDPAILPASSSGRPARPFAIATASHPAVGTRPVADAHGPLAGDPCRALEQLNVRLVLSRDVRILEKDHAVASPLEYLEGDFGVAAERPRTKTLDPGRAPGIERGRELIEQSAGGARGDAAPKTVEERARAAASAATKPRRVPIQPVPRRRRARSPGSLAAGGRAAPAGGRAVVRALGVRGRRACGVDLAIVL